MKNAYYARMYGNLDFLNMVTRTCQYMLKNKKQNYD